MSENDIENETQSAMDQMLDAIQQQNLSQSRAHFDMLMQDKIGDALDAEKVNIASQFYGGQQPEEDDLVQHFLDAELDTEEDYDETSAEDDDDIEQDVESAFEESDLEQELETYDDVEV